jgi:hypothetical protein
MNMDQVEAAVRDLDRFGSRILEAVQRPFKLALLVQRHSTKVSVDYSCRRDGRRRTFDPMLTSFRERSVGVPGMRDLSDGSEPWRGVPQSGHASAFKVISAPQHVQKAAMPVRPPDFYPCLMNTAMQRIRDRVGLQLACCPP